MDKLTRTIMAETQDDQSSESEGDKVVIFSGHSVVKGPKSFSELENESDENENK